MAVKHWKIEIYRANFFVRSIEGVGKISCIAHASALVLKYPESHINEYESRYGLWRLLKIDIVECAE